MDLMERTMSHSELLDFKLDAMTGQPRVGVSVFWWGGRVHKDVHIESVYCF